MLLGVNFKVVRNEGGWICFYKAVLDYITSGNIEGVPLLHQY